jgi:Family of unknown function (DUF6353)
MLTGLAHQVSKARFLLENHSTTILTGVGVAGTITTAVLTGRASFKAAEIIKNEKELAEEGLEFPETKIELSKATKVKLVWKQYLPPVASGIVTVTSIVVANKISSKKIAALAVAGGISERALQEYKDKVVEKLGDRQSQKLRDEIAQDRVNKNPYSSEVVLVGTGDVLCMDMITGRYFRSSVEDIKRAENKINHEILNSMGASLAEFQDELGMEETSYTQKVGWDGPDLVNTILSTTMSADGRPCIVVDFNRPPVLEWGYRRY